jgi:hypothetical protein
VTSQLIPIVAVVTSDEEDLEVALDDFTARQDDGYWARFVRRPYTPQRFIAWWIARRWVIPRDIRRA